MLKREQGQGTSSNEQIANKERCFLTLLIAICYLLSVSCNLFNDPLQDDYFDKIDGEIAWANAKKLNVHISYDREWGTSNPASGQITPLNVTSCDERISVGGIAGKFYSTTGTSDVDAPAMRMALLMQPVLAGLAASPILAALWDWSAVQSILIQSAIDR